MTFNVSDITYPEHVPMAVRRALNGAEVLHDATAVERAVDRLAVRMTADLQDDDPVIVAVLQGGLVLSGMLMRRLVFPLEQAYVHVGRYGDASSGGELTFKGVSAPELAGRTVVLVDDILDRGRTLEYLLSWANEQGAGKVLSAVLVVKDLSTPIARPEADYVALHCPDRFLVGSGMDYAGYGRNLPGIYAVAE